MSGYHGYRSIGDFITRNQKDLLAYLKPKKGRLPTFCTVRRVMQELDFNQLSGSFYNGQNNIQTSLKTNGCMWTAKQ
jgi:virulence-associated protein VapD